MATGMAPTIANTVLDGLGNNGTVTSLQVAQAYIQLHTADPGAAGTTAIAGNATRKTVSFSAASGGTLTNDAAITWSTSEVDTTEDYTHFTLWTASSAGTFLWSGTVTANAVTAGDTFTIATGDLDLALGVAS